MTGLDATAVQAVLREHGVECLATSDRQQDDVHGGQVVAFLHGNAGPEQQEHAVGVLRRLEGVQSVDVSSVSWTILVVRFRSTDQR